MSKAVSGPKCSLKLNGVKVVFVSGVNINQENALTRVDVIDQLESAELAETGHTTSFSCTTIKVDANAASALGLDPENLDDILSQPEMTMEMYNRIDDKVEYTMSGVKWGGGSGSCDARGLWTGSWNFEGRRGRGL